MTGIIFGLYIEPGKIVYIGKTTQRIEQRVSVMKQAARRGEKTAVSTWMREDGIKHVKAQLLDEVPVEDLATTTEMWITNLRKAGVELLNQTNGRGGNIAPASRSKQSTTRRSKTYADSSKANSKAKLASPYRHSDETKALQSLRRKMWWQNQNSSSGE